MSQAKVLLFGASGNLGKHLTQKLNEAGFHVAVFVREPERLEGAKQYAHEIHKGDATVDADLQGIFKGVDIVISAMGIRGINPKKQTCWDIDFQANMNVLNKCLEHSISYFYFLSMVGADKHRKDVPVFEARERVVDALKNSKLFGAKKISWKIIRSTPMFHDLTELYLMAAKNNVIRVGDGKTKVNPISAHDLADFVVSQVTNRGPTESGEVTVGGPDTLPIDDIVRIVLRVVGRESFSVTSVPTGLASIAAAVVKPFNPNASSTLDYLIVLSAKSKEVIGQTFGKRTLEDFFAHLHEGRDSKTSPGFFFTDIFAGSFYQRKFEIKEGEAGTTIDWQFQTLGGKLDISFGIFYSRIDDVRERVYDVVLPQKRVDSHLAMVSGSLKTEKPGFYYVRWDNSYSKLTPKLLEFKLTALKHQQQ